MTYLLKLNCNYKWFLNALKAVYSWSSKIFIMWSYFGSLSEISNYSVGLEIFRKHDIFHQAIASSDKLLIQYSVGNVVQEKCFNHRSSVRTCQSMQSIRWPFGNIRREIAAIWNTQAGARFHPITYDSRRPRRLGSRTSRTSNKKSIRASWNIINLNMFSNFI